MLSAYRDRMPVTTATTLPENNGTSPHMMAATTGIAPSVNSASPINAGVHMSNNSLPPNVAAGNGHQHKLKVEDALSYLDQVKAKFGGQPQVYNDFLDIMKEFKSQSIDTPGVIQRVSNLFRGNPELIVGFNTFLPPGYKIEVQDNEQVNVCMPGSNISHTIHPEGPPTPNVPPPPAVIPTPQPAIVTPQPQPQVLRPDSAAVTGAVPAAASATSSQPEFNHAINYVNKIKNRFANQPTVYKRFLEILHTYQRETRSTHEGGFTESIVYNKVAELFENQTDLLEEFGKFLPDATSGNAFDFAAAHSATKNASPGPIPIGGKKIADVQSAPIRSTTGVGGLGKGVLAQQSGPAASQQPQQQLHPIITHKRPTSLHINDEPVPKKSKLQTTPRDVASGFADIGRQGSQSELDFFSRVRRAMHNQDAYHNFLRCLTLYNQQVVGASELVRLVSPFLGRFPELFKWFKDYLKYKDVGPYTENVSNKVFQMSQQQQQYQDPVQTMDIDYNTCKRNGASYRALPKNYIQPKCSGRTPLCKEILNDTWVSFPSWSEDSTFVTSRKTQYEEYIYRCEEERFELDMVMELNRATIRVLESVQRRFSRMTADERARFRLDDTLGGTSTVIHQRAIRRLYGNKASEIIEGLKKNPVVAVPLVLRRLRYKDEEWREAQKSFNKVWRDQVDKYYLRSLDHQGMTFKQTDAKQIRSKNLLSEIETILEERREQSPEPSPLSETGPHLILMYPCDLPVVDDVDSGIDRLKIKTLIMDDTTNLLVHHIKRQTGINRDDKQKMKQLLRHFLRDLFSLPRCELSDDEDDMKEDGGEDEDRQSRNKDSGAEETAGNASESPPHDDSEQQQQPLQNVTLTNTISDDSYTLFFANDHWYLFLRLHCILFSRLYKLYARAQLQAAEERHDSKDRKQCASVALRLRQQVPISQYYEHFLDLVRNFLDCQVEPAPYEDSLRELFGIHAYHAYTLDKVIQNATRQLQHLVSDETSLSCSSYYTSASKRGGAGGRCATFTERVQNEASYQRRAEQLLVNETCVKVILYHDEGKMTMELLDTETGSEPDEEKAEKWCGYVNKIAGGGGEDSQEFDDAAAAMKTPLFLRRNVRARRQERSRRRGSASGVADNDVPTASETMSQDDAHCLLDFESYKMVFVVSKGSYLYNSKGRMWGRDAHVRVTRRMKGRFDEWHEKWLSQHTTPEQRAWVKEWLLGRNVENSRDVTTTLRIVDEPERAPYAPYHRYSTAPNNVPPVGS